MSEIKLLDGAVRVLFCRAPFLQYWWEVANRVLGDWIHSQEELRYSQSIARAMRDATCPICKSPVLTWAFWNNLKDTCYVPR